MEVEENQGGEGESAVAEGQHGPKGFSGSLFFFLFFSQLGDVMKTPPPLL